VAAEMTAMAPGAVQSNIFAWKVKNLERLEAHNVCKDVQPEKVM
jgi:hypothetical protein